MRHYKWLFLTVFSFLFLLPLQAIDFTISGQVSLFTADVPAPFNRLSISDESGTYTANVRTNFQGQYNAVFDIPEGALLTFEVSIRDICSNEFLVKTTTSEQATASVNFILCNEELIDPVNEEETEENEPEEEEDDKEEEEETDENNNDSTNSPITSLEDLLGLLDSLGITEIEEIDGLIGILDSFDIDGLDDLTDILDGIDGQNPEDVDGIIALLDSLDIDIDGLDDLTDILDGINGQNIEDIDDIIGLLDSLAIDIDGLDDLGDILDGIDGQNIEDIDDIIALLDSLDFDIDGLDELSDILDDIEDQEIEDIDNDIDVLEDLGINLDGLTDIFEDDEIFGGSIGSLLNQCNAFFLADNEGLSVAFFELNYGAVEKREWDFGDGTTSTESDPTHIYSAEGVYTVSLRITTKKGCTSEYTTDIVVETEGLIGAEISQLLTVASTRPTLAAATLYPTTVQDEVNLMLTFVENTDFEVQVLSINGYAIYRQKYTAFPGDNTLSLSMSNIPPGIYLTQIKTNNGIQSLKFVKN